MTSVAKATDRREQRTIRLRDVTLRDGLQDESPISTDTKTSLFDLLVLAGVTDLELTSFVRADRVPAMADAEELVASTHRVGGPTRWGLVLNDRGARRAIKSGLTHLQFVVSVSETHNLGNAGVDVDTSLRHLAGIVERAADAGAAVEVTLATAFWCPYDGPVPAGSVQALAERCLGAGATDMSLADTVGGAVPIEVGRLVSRLVEATGFAIGVHLHDTRGLALANAFAALDAGASRLDASLGGLGGCPFAPGASGNLAVEDLAHALAESGIDTGLDVEALIVAAEFACTAVGRPVRSHVGNAGPRRRLPDAHTDRQRR